MPIIKAQLQNKYTVSLQSYQLVTLGTWIALQSERVFTLVAEITQAQRNQLMQTSPTSVIIQHDFDQQTLEELKILRATRIDLIKKQLRDAEGTVIELISRGLLEKEEKEECVEELKVELKQKLRELESRQDKNNTVFFDEILLYTDLIS